MAQCVATTKGKERCPEQAKPGYKYCEEHKNRPKAIEERQDNGLGQIIDGSSLFNGDKQFIDSEPAVEDKPKSTVMTRPEPSGAPAISKAQDVVNKTFTMLDRAIDWEQKAWDKLIKLNDDEWRYTDKAGAEQLRSEISVYERAQDRVLRAVTTIAKLNIEAQSVNINKVVRELIKSVVMRVFERMDMDQQQIDQARKYLAEEFEKVSATDE